MMTEARFVASASYYEELEAAVLQTPRGRWFLREFAARNRQADTLVTLKSIDRLLHAVKHEASLGPVEILRRELHEMSHAIAQTRREIAAIKPSDPSHNRIMAATEELDAIVTATERATGDILTAAERLQELAKTLREQGATERQCDEITALATNILVACSFQDLTGQRTTKVVNVLRYLEQRVNAMIDIWGVDGVTPIEDEKDINPDHQLLSGPAREGEGVSQEDIDRLLSSDGATSADGSEEKPEPIDQDAIDAMFA